MLAVLTPRRYLLNVLYSPSVARLWGAPRVQHEPLDDPELLELLQPLPSWERELLDLRFGLDGRGTHTVQEAAQELGVSLAHARQLEHRALQVLRARAAERPWLAPDLDAARASVRAVLRQLQEELLAERAVVSAQSVPTDGSWRAGVLAGRQAGKLVAFDMALERITALQQRPPITHASSPTPPATVDGRHA